jgi:hypothetical protein
MIKMHQSSAASSILPIKASLGGGENTASSCFVITAATVVRRPGNLQLH